MYDPYVAFLVGMLCGVVLGIVVSGILSAIANNIDKKDVYAVQKPEGEWVNETCNLCGQYVWHGECHNFCPNCGAKMKDRVIDDHIKIYK